MLFARTLAKRFATIAPLFAFAFLANGCMPAYFPSFADDSIAGQHISALRIPLAEVIKQVKCEVNAFIVQEKDRQKDKPLAVYLQAPIQIDLNVKVDELGNVAFTAIDLKRMGFDSLAHFISAKNPPIKDLTPFLNASIQGRNVRNVTVSVVFMPHFKVDPNDVDCSRKDLRDANRLYITEWLAAYADASRNIPVEDSGYVKKDYDKAPGADSKDPKDPKIMGEIRGTKMISYSKTGVGARKQVKDLYLNAIQMQTEFHVIVDVTAGINVFNKTGPTTGFYLIPVLAPPSVEIKPDYSHTLTVQFKGRGAGEFLDITDPQNTNPAATEIRNRSILLLAPTLAPSAGGRRTLP